SKLGCWRIPTSFISLSCARRKGGFVPSSIRLEASPMGITPNCNKSSSKLNSSTTMRDAAFGNKSVFFSVLIKTGSALTKNGKNCVINKTICTRIKQKRLLIVEMCIIFYPYFELLSKKNKAGALGSVEILIPRLQKE